MQAELLGSDRAELIVQEPAGAPESSGTDAIRSAKRDCHSPSRWLGALELSVQVPARSYRRVSNGSDAGRARVCPGLGCIEVEFELHHFGPRNLSLLGFPLPDKVPPLALRLGFVSAARERGQGQEAERKRHRC